MGFNSFLQNLRGSACICGFKFISFYFYIVEYEHGFAVAHSVWLALIFFLRDDLFHKVDSW